MRIESIEIQNFRQFNNLNISFSHNKGNDLHIVFANNGVGKTNLLNAITWCLYDAEMHLGDRSTAVPIPNTEYVDEIRKNLPSGQNKIVETKVKIQLVSDNMEEKIYFDKTGRFNITEDEVIPVGTQYTIMQNLGSGWETITQEEEWRALVKKYVPEEIHEYIFFDGEHLENYFRSQQSEKIKNGIEELTQARIMKKAEDAFKNFIDSELNPKIASSGNNEIINQQNLVEEKSAALESSIFTIEEYNKQIKKCDEEIDELDTIISGHTNVAEKTDQLKSVEEQITKKNKLIKEKNENIMINVRKNYISFSMYPSIKELFIYIRERERKGKLPPRIDKFLLKAIEEKGHCSICDQDLSTHSIEFIKKLREELEVSSETSALLNKSSIPLQQYLSNISNYKTNIELLLEDLKTEEEELESLQKEEEKLTNYLMNIPNQEEIAKAITKRKEFKEARDKIVANKGIEENHKKEFEKTYEKEKEKLDLMMQKNEQLEVVRKQKEYCEKCRNIIRASRIELLEESRNEMQEETFKTFQQLIWKEDAFSSVEILDDYTFRLLDRFGTQTLGSCSAAERALLALSFTMALQKVSMHDSLLFIDTPLGRVDLENRKNFTNTLCEISKYKQVILTFTPSEYDENVQAALSGRYSTFNTLSIEDNYTVVK